MPVVGNIKGVTGTAGTNGTNGTNGVAGTQWHNSAGAPSVQTGAKLAELTAAAAGDMYLNDTTGDVYTKVQAAGSVWLDSP